MLQNRGILLVAAKLLACQERLCCWLVSWLAGWLVIWLVVWLVGWLVLCQHSSDKGNCYVTLNPDSIKENLLLLFTTLTRIT